MGRRVDRRSQTRRTAVYRRLPPALAQAVASVEAESGERIAIFRAQALLPNAVVLGGGRIVLSEGLLKTLNEAELEAVLVVVSGFSTQSEYADMRRSETAEAASVGSVLSGMIAGPIAWFLLLLGAGRGLVWSSDATAAPMTQWREALVSAIEKIERISAPPTSFHRAQYSLITVFWNHLFFANPLEGTPLQRFASLPSARARVDRLSNPHQRVP